MSSGHIKKGFLLSIFFSSPFLLQAQTIPCSFFDYPLSLRSGSAHQSVPTIQKILNNDPDTQVSRTGPGSPGYETNKYGFATTEAVKRFQEKYRVEILTPLGLKEGTGVFGSRTSRKMASLCLGMSNYFTKSSDFFETYKVARGETKESVKEIKGITSLSLATSRTDISQGESTTFILKSSHPAGKLSTLEVMLDGQAIQILKPTLTNQFSFEWSSMNLPARTYLFAFLLYDENRTIIARNSASVNVYTAPSNTPPPTPQPSLINGLCGQSHALSFSSLPTNFLCSSGTVTQMNTTKSGWTWSCEGQNGGYSTSCFAKIASLPPEEQIKFVSAEEFKRGELRGVGIINSSQYREEDYYASLAERGANVVRLWVDLKVMGPSSRARYMVEPVSYSGIDRTIAMGEKYGFKVILVSGTDDATEGGILWEDARVQQSYASMWKEVADRYKNSPIIAGYDIMNEPVVVEDRLIAKNTFEPIAKKIVDTIREVDKNHVIIIEPANGGETYAFAELTPINPEDKKIVYSVHTYRPHQFTHQGVYPIYPYGVEYPTTTVPPPQYGPFNLEWLRRDIQPVIDFQGRYDVPIYVGEFSAIRWAPGNSRENYLRDLLTIFKENNWSWTYHSWRTWPGWDAEIESNATSTDVVRTSSGPVIMLLENALKGNSKTFIR